MSCITYAGTLYFVHWLGVKELELFLCSIFVLSFMYAWPFCLYSIPKSGPLSSTPATKRNQTLHLFACVWVCMCVDGICACLQCALRPFVVCTAAYSKAHVYSLHSSPPSTSSLTETNVVLILISNIPKINVFILFIFSHNWSTSK